MMPPSRQSQIDDLTRRVKELEKRAHDREIDIHVMKLAHEIDMDVLVKTWEESNTRYREALDKIAHLDSRVYPEAVSIAVDTLESIHYR